MPVRLTRRAAIALAGAVLAAGALPAFAGDAAVAFVKALYQLPYLWSDVAGSAAGRAKYLTSEFAAVVDGNGKYSGELEFAVDYEPFTQAQDWELKNVTFTLEKSAGDAATVRVDFVSFDRPTTVRFSLARSAAGWRLADLFNGEGASLKQEYADLNAAGRAVRAGN